MEDANTIMDEMLDRLADGVKNSEVSVMVVDVEDVRLVLSYVRVLENAFLKAKGKESSA